MYIWFACVDILSPFVCLLSSSASISHDPCCAANAVILITFFLSSKNLSLWSRISARFCWRLHNIWYVNIDNELCGQTLIFYCLWLFGSFKSPYCPFIGKDECTYIGKKMYVHLLEKMYVHISEKMYVHILEWRLLQVMALMILDPYSVFSHNCCFSATAFLQGIFVKDRKLH